MGTRRSKHNFGRKPLYKEHRRSLAIAELAFRTYGPNPELVELHRRFNGRCFYCNRETFIVPKDCPDRATRDHYVPTAHGGADEDSNIVLSCWACNGAKGNKLPTPELIAWLKVKTPRQSPARHSPKPVQTELEAQVETYLARKKAERGSQIEVMSPLTRHNAEILAAPERVRGHEIEIIVGEISVSSYDILMQLFLDKKIHGAQFSAGRLWQRQMQASTLQPARCVDWSAPVSRSYKYQPRGTITERQFEAMKDRAAFRAIAGAKIVSALDVCLEHGRGVVELRQMLNLSGAGVVALVSALLDEFARFAAYSSAPDPIMKDDRKTTHGQRGKKSAGTPMARDKRRSRVPVLRKPEGLRLPPPQRIASLPVLHLP